MTPILYDNILFRTTDLHAAFMDKTVFIAGRGFFGRWFQGFFEHLNKRGINVSVQAASKSGGWDINDPSTYSEFQKSADYIINACGSASAQLPDEEIVQQHLAGPINLRSHTKPGAVMLQISSGAAINPKNCYGSCKQAAENHLLSMGGKTQIVRVFATIGPGMDLNTHFAIPTFIRNTLAGQPIAAIPGVSRSFAHVCDVITQCLHVMINGDGKPYDVGSDDLISIEDAANLISENVIWAGRDTFQSNAAVNLYAANLTRIKDQFNLGIDWSSRAAILSTWRAFSNASNTT
jgi:nucleoside-diphosphate-sugar epimerase